MPILRHTFLDKHLLFFYNFLATTTTVFKFSTTPAPSLIASRKIMYIPIRSASPSSLNPSKITEPDETIAPRLGLYYVATSKMNGD